MSTQKYRVRSGEDLGRVVRDARAVHGLTQQQLVDQLEVGFDRSRLARIEAGEGFQSLDRVLSVLRRLGVEVYAQVPVPAGPNDHEPEPEPEPDEFVLGTHEEQAAVGRPPQDPDGDRRRGAEGGFPCQ